MTRYNTRLTARTLLMGLRALARVRVHVPLHRLDETLPVPSRQTAGAVGYDLYARQTCVVPAHSEVIIPLNCVFGVPPGFVLLIIPRSSTLRRLGLLCGNSVGVLDPDFRGTEPGAEDEAGFLAWNPRDTPVVVERGVRVAQGLIVAVPDITFVPFQGRSVGRRGWGSTGA